MYDITYYLYKIFKFVIIALCNMVSVNISIPSDILASVDKERRWVQRSTAITKALEYLLTQPNTIRGLCGADKLPPEYQVE